jgi:NitT/TauT family transport system substrate-binding protein
MKRLGFPLAFAASAVLLAFHVAQGQSALTVVRAVGPPNDGYKAVYYGVKSGIFKKYGLDVQTSIVASGAAAAAALSGGAADIAYTNILTLVQAHTHNVPMTFVAPGNLQLTGKSQTDILVLADSPIKSGKDLIGKTLGSASLRDINAAASLAWIDKTGGDSKTLKVVEVPASAGTAFLEEHRADAVTLNEPAVSLAVATGKVRILAAPYDAVGTGMTAGFAAMEPYVAANRDAMERFAKAMHEASLYTNAHPADTVDLVAAYSGVAPDVVAKSVRFMDAEYLEPRYLQPMIDLCARYQLIDKDFPAADVISLVAVKPPR